jgi:ABC-type nitrate/sulfonate/bicarbonate transport system substrate-binding protein
MALLVQAAPPSAIVLACRNGIIRAAMPFDPLSVEAVSAGKVRAVADGGQVAPLSVRIVYARLGGPEVRKAKVACRVDASGAVISVA